MGRLKDGNIQVTTVLSKEILDNIDEEAKQGYRTRSQQIAKIIIEYFQDKKEKRKD